MELTIFIAIVAFLVVTLVLVGHVQVPGAFGRR